jgi:hypothetical protein
VGLGVGLDLMTLSTHSMLCLSALDAAGVAGGEWCGGHGLGLFCIYKV